MQDRKRQDRQDNKGLYTELTETILGFVLMNLV